MAKKERCYRDNSNGDRRDNKIVSHYVTEPPMQETTTSTKTSTPTVPNWGELLPDMFSNSHFHKSKTSRRRWHAEINGSRVGVVVAWRPADYENHALNIEDVDKLLELKRAASFDAAYVVLATTGENFASSYVGHRDAEELSEKLEAVHFRTGPHGDYWLLRGDFSPLDAEPDFPGW